MCYCRHRMALCIFLTMQRKLYCILLPIGAKASGFLPETVQVCRAMSIFSKGPIRFSAEPQECGAMPVSHKGAKAGRFLLAATQGRSDMLVSQKGKGALFRR